jgi:gas vesicle protein
MQEQNQNKNFASAEMFMAGALVGAVLGAVIGLLLSPASGEENRRQVSRYAKKGKELAEDLYDEVEHRASQFRDEAEDYVHDLEKNIKPIKKQAERYASQALDKAEDTIKDARKKYFSGVKM